jgi:hypothetical protein
MLVILRHDFNYDGICRGAIIQVHTSGVTKSLCIAGVQNNSVQIASNTTSLNSLGPKKCLVKNQIANRFFPYLSTNSCFDTTSTLQKRK